MMIGKAIIRWAHEQGLRGKQTLPTVTFTPKKKRVRPAFELSEFRILWRVLCRRIQTARDKRIRTSRDLLRLAEIIFVSHGPANNRSITQRDPTGHWASGSLARATDCHNIAAIRAFISADGGDRGSDTFRSRNFLASREPRMQALRSQTKCKVIILGEIAKGTLQ
jgi:hypothetical protein